MTDPPPHSDTPWLTEPEARALTGLGHDSLRNIRHVRIRRSLRWHIDDLLDHVQARRDDESPPPTGTG